MKKILSGVLALVLAGSAFALDSENFIPEGTVASYTKTEYAVSTKFGDYFRSVAAKHVHVFANGLKKDHLTMEKMNLQTNLFTSTIQAVSWYHLHILMQITRQSGRMYTNT